MSLPTSRCLIKQERCSWMNSMGSSRVIITPLRVSAMRLTIDARVVDFPEPVTPVTRMRPPRKLQSS